MAMFLVKLWLAFERDFIGGAPDRPSDNPAIAQAARKDVWDAQVSGASNFYSESEGNQYDKYYGVRRGE